METVIRKWGNSPALRLPAAVLKEAGYQLEQKVDLVVSRGRIIIQPSRKIEYDLDTLVSGIHAGNTHDEVNYERPVGSEALSCHRVPTCLIPATSCGCNSIHKPGMSRRGTVLPW